MADLTAQRALGTNTAFIGRVLMAAFSEADRVSDEAPTTPFHEQRVNYGTLFVRVPEAEGAKLALACAAQTRIQGVEANATDTNIWLALRDVWNTFAGVVTV